MRAGFIEVVLVALASLVSAKKRFLSLVSFAGEGLKGGLFLERSRDLKLVRKLEGLPLSLVVAMVVVGIATVVVSLRWLDKDEGFLV